MKIFILVFIFFLSSLNISSEAFFGRSMAEDSDKKEKTGTSEQIPIRDSAYFLIQKRLKEARKLIEEGKKMINKGEKKNNQSLVVKGQIKKEIGEKQLQILNDQAENKEKQDERNSW